ncbi:type III secretion inner membrane ring lipoprotein SctJ [Paraburkholderia sediminicola]|uniref:type III secretion system inner membrane ring lipoprotein SctJ n=1 Tax=Paraburkholderia sediminicola TaxID=458836 RepID=UPI0038B84040
MVRASFIALGLAVLLLAGCKVELYNGLKEDEANQMLALLKARSISASKTLNKGGDVQLDVEESQFAEAVEALRQSGFPKDKNLSVTDLFPAGQLVSSPDQERAKITFLKEQGLERMLAALDGVVVVRVELADASQNPDGTEKPRSASVFIKYSPEENFRSNEDDIKRLVLNSETNLEPQNIAVVLQPASYRFIAYSRPANALPWWIEWVRMNSLLTVVIGVGFCAFGAALGSLIYFLRLRRRNR